jgi:CBS domain-containing protein
MRSSPAAPQHQEVAQVTTAREIMTSPVQCCDEGDSLVDVAKALQQHGVGSLPVKAADGSLVGMVTDRDIVTKAIAEGRDVATTTAGDLASGKVVTVEANDSAEQAGKALADNQIRRVPVMDGRDVVGMISQADIARSLSNGETGDVVQAISQR